MTEYKVLITETNGRNFTTVIKAVDLYTATRQAKATYSAPHIRSTQILGPCSAVGR